MKTEQAQELVAGLSQLIKDLSDAEARALRKMRGGTPAEQNADDAEAAKNALLQSAVMLLGGVAVNVARLADAAERIAGVMEEEGPVVLFKAEDDDKAPVTG